MSPITGRLDLTAWRNDDWYEYPLRVRGVDLRGIVLAMQIRKTGDTSGLPLVSLSNVTKVVQGLRFVDTVVQDGIEVSEVRIRMDRQTLQDLPYYGDLGEAADFDYAFLIGGRTRLVGKFILPAHAYGSDNAPDERPESFGLSMRATVPDGGATLTIDKDGGASVSIDGADLVSASILRAESARDEAVAAADDTVAALDSLGQDAFNYVGRPADAVLVTGTPKGVGSVFWHDAVDVAGNLTSVDVFDRAAGVVNVAVYRGPLNALVRVGLGSFATTGTGTSRRIALAAPLPVRAADILAIQPADGALAVAEVQSGDVGYTYSSPFLPENVSLGAPTTNGQVQVRFVITYREQIVTADNFLALSEIRVIGARARALSSAANPAGYVAWTTTGAPTGHTVTWGSYTAKLGPLADRMEFPQWSISKPLFVAGNSLSTSTDVTNRYSQLLAARFGQHLVSVANYSSDQRMVYRTGAAPISLTLAGALPAGDPVAVTQINGAPIDGNNPAAFLTTGDPAVVTGMSMTGYASRNGVERKVTVSAPNGASFAYSVTQAPGQTAVNFDGPVLFTPEASLSIRGSTCIVWMGNNFFYSQVPNQYGDYTNPQMWVDLQLIVSFLQSQGCQVLLLPVIPASLPEWVEGVGTPLTASRAANARTEQLFPGLMARHADGRDLIKFLQDRRDGSADAQADVAKGWIPRNLHRLGDALHLNANGDIAVADFVDSALRSQVGPPAITQATTFTITAQGPQAGSDATASVRVTRDQLASLADAVDGVVQDAVYRPTIAAAIADFEVGTFFVSRDLDGLTDHAGVKWQYKVTAAPPYFSDEGAWSDTNAAALGLDAYVGTTPTRLPVSIDQADAISRARADALASTSALGLMTGAALDRRVRTDAVQPLSADEKAIVVGNIGAVAAGLFDTRVPIVAIEELGGVGDYDPVTRTGTNNDAAFALAAARGVRVQLRPGGRYMTKSTIRPWDKMAIIGDSGYTSAIYGNFDVPVGGGYHQQRVIGSNPENPAILRNLVLYGFAVVRDGPAPEHGVLLDNFDGLYADIDVFATSKEPTGGAFGVSAFYPDCRPSKNAFVRINRVTYGGNFALQFGNVDSGSMELGNAQFCHREVLGLEPYALGKYRFQASAVAADVLFWPGHGKVTGQPLIYSYEGSVPFPGLASKTSYYFVIRVDADHVRIAASKEEALAGVSLVFGAPGANTHYHAFIVCGVLRNIKVKQSNVDTGDVASGGSGTGSIIITATSGGYHEGIDLSGMTVIERNPTSGSIGVAVFGAKGWVINGLSAVGQKSFIIVAGTGFVQGIKDATGDIGGKAQDGVTSVGVEVRCEGVIRNVMGREFQNTGIKIQGDVIVENADLRSTVATGPAITMVNSSHVSGGGFIRDCTVKVPNANPLAVVTTTKVDGVNVDNITGRIVRQTGCKNLNDERSSLDWISKRRTRQTLLKAVSNIAAAGTADAGKTTIASLMSSDENASVTCFSGRVRITARQTDSTNTNVANYELSIMKAAASVAATVKPLNSDGLTTGAGASHPSFAFGINSAGALAAAVVGSTLPTATWYFDIEASGDLLLA